jgi:hypothetical protein
MHRKQRTTLSQRVTVMKPYLPISPMRRHSTAPSTPAAHTRHSKRQNYGRQLQRNGRHLPVKALYARCHVIYATDRSCYVFCPSRGGSRCHPHQTRLTRRRRLHRAAMPRKSAHSGAPTLRRNAATSALLFAMACLRGVSFSLYAVFQSQQCQIYSKL